jgi:hypothetical protein
MDKYVCGVRAFTSWYSSPSSRILLSRLRMQNTLATLVGVIAGGFAAYASNSLAEAIVYALSVGFLIGFANLGIYELRKRWRRVG